MENSILFPREPSRFSMIRDEDAKEVQRLFIHCKSVPGLSDIYIKSGRPIKARVHGKIKSVTSRILDHAEVRDILVMMYGGNNAEIEVRKKPLDNAYSIRVDRDTTLRYRWSATGTEYNGNFAIAIVLRELPAVPPRLDKTHFQDGLFDALFTERGLVLICGETGSGKSTLMAGIVTEIMLDPESNAHIIEYAAPIEFVYDEIQKISPSCEVDQSAVPDHLGSFADGIRNSLRRDPDIILIGESRDAETIKAALLASQTGHAVYTTLHSSTVPTTFLRLIQTLPVEEMNSVLGSLIDMIQVVLCQELIPSLDGKRVPLREWLVINDDMRREMLKAASQNVMTLPYVVGELVSKYGMTRLRNAELLAEKGLIDPMYVDKERLAQQKLVINNELISGNSGVNDGP